MLTRGWWELFKSAVNSCLVQGLQLEVSWRDIIASIPRARGGLTKVKHVGLQSYLSSAWWATRDHPWEQFFSWLRRRGTWPKPWILQALATNFWLLYPSLSDRKRTAREATCRAAPSGSWNSSTASAFLLLAYHLSLAAGAHATAAHWQAFTDQAHYVLSLFLTN